MENWSVEKKWLMIHQDHQAEQMTSSSKKNKTQLAMTERTSLDMSRLPATNSESTISPLSPTPSKYNYGPVPMKSSSSPIKLVNNISNISKPASISNSNSSITNNTPNKSSTSPTLKRTQSIVNLSNSVKKLTNINDHHFDTFAADNNTPEFFVKKFLDPNLRSVTPKIAANLEVCLRTRSIK